MFTFLIAFSALIAFLFPQYFIEIQGYPLKNLIIPLLQVIMFGMGTTMTIKDFRNILRTPKAVLVGIMLQFTIMPLLGYSIASLFDFPPEISAGIILVGCSPSGLASNVMTFIAKGNVPLSITMTSVATILAPIVTPALMQMLGNQYINIDFWHMTWDISKMIIIPIFLGLLVSRMIRGYDYLLQYILPVISMAGITFIIMIITAAGQKSLLTVGFALVLAVLMHNLGGYILGYWGGRLFRLNENDCRTVAIEVGLQNAGLASGLAVAMGKMTTVGISPALFGPIMNITDSFLEAWWGKRGSER